MSTRFPSHHVSLFLLGLTFLGICSIALRPHLVMTENRLARLPMQIGTLDGTEMHFEDSVYAALNADANLLRVYRSSAGDTVALYVGYYGTAKGGRASHLPQYCYTGQGWSIERWDFASLEASSPSRHRINRMIVRKGVERQLVYFWFQTEATVMATGLEQNWYKFQHRLLHDRSDGAFVRVSMNLTAGKEVQVEQTAKRFSEAVVPLLSTFWPNEGPGQS